MFNSIHRFLLFHFFKEKYRDLIDASGEMYIANLLAPEAVRIAKEMGVSLSDDEFIKQFTHYAFSQSQFLTRAIYSENRILYHFNDGMRVAIGALLRMEHFGGLSELAKASQVFQSYYISVEKDCSRFMHHLIKSRESEYLTFSNSGKPTKKSLDIFKFVVIHEYPEIVFDYAQKRSLCFSEVECITMVTTEIFMMGYE